MRIAMIGHKRVPSRSGGVEVVVEELSKRMAAKGNSVDIYNRRAGEEKIDRYGDCRVFEIRTSSNPKLNAVIYSFFAVLKAIFKHYDVIHFHAEGPCAVLPLAKLFGKTCVATIHGLDWQRDKWGGFATKYLKFGEKAAAKYADEVIVLSQNVKQYFKDTYNRETVYIPNGIEKFDIGGEEIIKAQGLKKRGYLLYLARITTEKGLHYLLEAYSKTDTDMPLVVAGDISKPNAYINQIKETAKRDSRVKLVGFVSGALLDALYSNCYLYILPSDLEGMPLSLLEAIGHGARCLASDIPENKEIADDYIHFFKSGDVGSLNEALRDLLAKEAAYDTNFGLCRSADETEETLNRIRAKYDWDTVTDKTLAVYQKALRA